MDIEQIKQLIACLEKSKLSKLHLKQGEFEICLEKEGRRVKVVPNEEKAPFESEVSLHGERGGTPHVPEVPGTYVTSPMVGTFYSCPAPGKPSFVNVGDVIHEQTVVCIVEAMKVMNEVKAGVSGTVAEVFVENGKPVDFGMRLIRVT